MKKLNKITPIPKSHEIVWWVCRGIYVAFSVYGILNGSVTMFLMGLFATAFSHLWDMRGVAFDAPVSTHGIQCAVATLIAARLYEYLQAITPDRARGLAYAAQFDRDAWFLELSDFLGDGARDMIALEQKERKYCTHKHAERLEIILEHWDELIGIMHAEIPNADTLEALLDQIGCPKTPQTWGIFPDSLPVTFKATKDIRDKYVLSRLAFDLGVLEEMAALCGGEEYRA